MMRTGAAEGHSGYFHEAAYYGSDDEFVDLVRPFLVEGLHAGEPTIVACAERNTQLVRRSMDCSGLRFLSGADHYISPPGAIRAYLTLFGELLAEGAAQIRVVGDVPQIGATGWDGWARYEAAANAVFEDLPLWGLCPYDTRAATPQVLGDVACTHPRLATTDGGHRPSDAFVEPATFFADLERRAGEKGPDRGAPGAELVDPAPSAARAAILALARTELDEPALADLGLVVSEVVTNAHVHGLPPVTVRAWLAPGRVSVAVHDHGPGPADPLVGWRPPPATGLDGRGLWLAHQLCRDVRIDRHDGCRVSFSVERAEPR